jgi:hypothetical protein
MRHHELAGRGLRSMEKVEQDDGVEAAGYGDQRGAAGQREGGEVGAEPGREVHRQER